MSYREEGLGLIVESEIKETTRELEKSGPCLFFGCGARGARDNRLAVFDPILYTLTFCPDHLDEALNWLTEEGCRENHR